jgi:hypothetical protein
MADIKLKQGEAKPLNLTVTDEHGRAVDLTGATLFLGVKRHKEDEDYLISKANNVFNVESAALGKVSVPLSAEDTYHAPGRLVGELKVTFHNLEILKSNEINIVIEKSVISS